MSIPTMIKVLILAVFIRPIASFYIPGVAPLDFRKGENVEVKVNESLLV